MAFFNTSNNQGAAAASSGWGVLDGIVGIGGQVGEFWLQKQANDVRIAEAKKTAAQQQSEAVAAASSALNRQNMVNVFKWGSIAVVGLVLGSQLIRFVKSQVKGA